MSRDPYDRSGQQSFSNLRKPHCLEIPPKHQTLLNSAFDDRYAKGQICHFPVIFVVSIHASFEATSEKREHNAEGWELNRKRSPGGQNLNLWSGLDVTAEIRGKTVHGPPGWTQLVMPAFPKESRVGRGASGEQERRDSFGWPVPIGSPAFSVLQTGNSRGVRMSMTRDPKIVIDPRLIRTVSHNCRGNARVSCP
jgi:hypothetical protein